ncbi:MAG TPA: MFS transporter [Stellaceae bacterium]|nr:MFS transporter [Stellaceae bacterium]
MKAATGEAARGVAAGVGRAAQGAGESAVFAILWALSFSHLLNDMIASLVPAIYPLFKSSFSLDYAEVGLITLAYQCTASIFQPVVGLYTDHRPQPYSLAAGMGFTLLGLVLLSFASSFAMVIGAASLVGLGSSIFHPESSRVARMASGGQHGLAQSLFQVGGNLGSSLGPLLAAFIVIPRGQGSIAWFTLAAFTAMLVLWRVGSWYKGRRHAHAVRGRMHMLDGMTALSQRTVALSLLVLLVLIFSKFFYSAGLTNYYIFYLMDRFHLPVGTAQIYLFVYLASVALGTLVGGPIVDRFGRKFVIWFSIVGVFPFTLALPYANLFWTGILTVLIGVVMSSAFSAILVYAQDLIPGRVGMVGGLFFGLAFGMAGIAAAVLGWIADLTSIRFVYQICAFLPLLGLLTWFLPNIERRRAHASA